MKFTFYKEERFKETLIGKIPEDWRVVRISKLFNMYKGTTPSTKVKEFWNGDIPFVTPTDITKISGLNKTYLETTENYISRKGLKSKGLKLVPENSLLFTSRATIGYLAINKVKVAINQGIISLIPKNMDAEVTFFYYLLQKLKNLFENLAAGSTYKEISMSIFSNIGISLPPLEEQKAIAHILSTVDEAIQKTNGIIEKVKRLKKGLMRELLTKGIGHKEFKDTEIGRIPKEWEVVKLRDIASIKGRIGWHGLRDEDYLTEGECFLIRGIDFENGKVIWEKCVYISKEWYERDPNIQVKEDDILITKDGTIGKIALIENLPKKATLGTGIFRIRLLENTQCLPKFLFYIFNSLYFEKFIQVLSAGSTLSHLYQKDLVNFKLPLPPLTEQKKIAEILSIVDKRLEVERKRKERLERMKKALMDLLLTGKIRVKI